MNQSRFVFFKCRKVSKWWLKKLNYQQQITQGYGHVLDVKQYFIKRYTCTIIRTFVYITWQTVSILKRGKWHYRHFNNDARSGQAYLQCYNVLELIKDGRVTASRYSSKVLRLQTPNVVVIFSNANPDINRWKVIHINKNELNVQENRLWKQRHSRERLTVNWQVQ